MLERSFGMFPGYTALALVGGSSMTYATLQERIHTTVRGLEHLGVAGGDRVAILSENMPNWAVAYFAITTMGAVVVPLLPDFSDTEVGNILEHCDARVVFASSTLSPKLPSKRKRRIIGLENFEGLPDKGSRKKTPRWKEPEEETLAAIIYTSGTTGKSKGVMLTHKNLVSNAEAARPLAAANPGECALSILPLAHTYECTIGLLAPMSAGMAVYYLGDIPAPSILLPALAEVRPHLLLAVPLIIEKIYRGRVERQLRRSAVLRTALRFPPARKLLHRATGRRLMKTFGGRLRFFGFGGAPLAPDVELFLKEAKIPYGIGYGLTETSPLIAACNPRDQVFRSTGFAVEGVEIRVADPEPRSGEGELQVRGPNVMRGYYLDPDRTNEAFTPDGWFRTGDLGVVDSRGRVFVKGRLKNVIISSRGENIYPEELESVINARSMVVDSIVTSDGAQLKALVNLDFDLLREHIASQEGVSADGVSPQRVREETDRYLRKIRAEVNRELSSFSHISRFELRSEPFEKTPTMKIKRYLYDDRLQAVQR
ncbi:MAG: AMP-binding protein [bacterium]